MRLVPLRYRPAAHYWYQCLTRTAEPELSLVRSFALTGTTAIDVGANAGVYTYAMVKAGAQVEAFEPQPVNRYLRAFASRHRVHVHEVALSDRGGHTSLHIPLVDGRPIGTRASISEPPQVAETMTVETRTLDSYNFRNVSLIKIDVEGHEWQVISGGLVTIRRDKPRLIVEIEAAHGVDVDSTVRRIGRLGYRLADRLSAKNYVFEP